MDIDSAIVAGFSERQRLGELLEFPRDQKWTLLYRATRDGFGAGDFHWRCDGRARTLTLVRSTFGNVFGGYTSCEWGQSEEFKGGLDDFMFSLRNEDDAPLKLRKFLFDSSIYCSSSCGPAFGNASGLDLKLADRADSNESSYSDLGFSFSHPKYKNGSYRARGFLAGSHNFRVADIEVFQAE